MPDALLLAFICFLGAGAAAGLCVPSPTIVKSWGVIVGRQITGATGDDYRRVELDVMVRRPDGGQFPAHETALVPASALVKISPGSIVDAYYRSGDESEIALFVPPG